MFKYLEKRKVWLVYVPLAIYWLILIVGTSLPIDRMPIIGLSDKLNHLVAYFGLAILLNLTLIYQRKSRLFFDKASLVTIIICLFYGVVDELHQILIPGRFADTYDWIADSLGTLIGVLVLNFLINQLKYQPEFK